MNGKIWMFVVTWICLLFLLSPALSQEKIVGSVSGTCDGFMDLSLSEVKYVSSDPDLNKPAFSLTVSQNCAGRSATGYKSAPDKAKQGFTITTTMDYQKLIYPIQTQSLATIYKIHYQKFWTLGDAWSKCRDYYLAQGGEKPELIGLGFGYYLCKWETRVGYWGALAGYPEHDWKTTINVKLDNGETSSVSLTRASKSGKTSLLYAYWTGNLISGIYALPNPNTVSVVYMNGWKLYRHFDYNKLYTEFKSCWSKYVNPPNEAGLRACADLYNNELSSYLSDASRTALVIPGVATSTTSGTLQSGVVTLDVTSNPYFYPVLTLKIDADWVGIKVPVTQPMITGISQTPSPITTSGYIVVKVYNSGEDGAINVYATCNSNLVHITPSNNVPIKHGETKEVKLYVTTGTTNYQQIPCTITVQDYNEPTVKVSKPFTLKIAPLPECFEEGATRCSFDKKAVEMCINGKWKTVQVCEYMCEEVNGMAKCKTKPIPPPVPPEEECEWWDIVCHIRKGLEWIGNLIKTTLMWFGLFVVLIIFGPKILDMIKQRVKKWNGKYCH